MSKTVLLAALVALAPMATAEAQQPGGRLEWGLGAGPVWPGPAIGVAIWGAYRVLRSMAFEMGVGGFEREYPYTPFLRESCLEFVGCFQQRVDEPKVLDTGGAEVGLRAFRRLGPVEPFAGMGVGLYRSELDGPEELGPYGEDWGAGLRLGLGADLILGPEIQILGGSVRLGVEYRYLRLTGDFGQGEVGIGGSRASLRFVCVY